MEALGDADTTRRATAADVLGDIGRACRKTARRCSSTPCAMNSKRCASTPRMPSAPIDGNGLRAGALADALDSEEDEWVRRYARAELAATGKRRDRCRSAAQTGRPFRSQPLRAGQIARSAAAHGHLRSDVCSVRHAANAALVSAYGHRQWVLSEHLSCLDTNRATTLYRTPHMIQTTVTISNLWQRTSIFIFMPYGQAFKLLLSVCLSTYGPDADVRTRCQNAQRLSSRDALSV